MASPLITTIECAAVPGHVARKYNIPASADADMLVHAIRAALPSLHGKRVEFIGGHVAVYEPHVKLTAGASLALDIQAKGAVAWRLDLFGNLIPVGVPDAVHADVDAAWARWRNGACGSNLLTWVKEALTPFAYPTGGAGTYFVSAPNDATYRATTAAWRRDGILRKCSIFTMEATVDNMRELLAQAAEKLQAEKQRIDAMAEGAKKVAARERFAASLETWSGAIGAPVATLNGLAEATTTDAVADILASFAF